MIPRVLTPLLMLGLATCGSSSGKDVTVTDAEIRLPVVAGRPGAAYFTLTGGDQAMRLVSVEGPAATRIELHSSMMMNGHMEMHRLDGMRIAPGEKISFAPGGNHAMLFGLDPALKPGATTRLTFRFEKGAPAMAEARVVAGADAR